MEPALLHLADLAAIALGEGIHPEQVVPPLDEEAWRLVDLAPESMETFVTQSERQIAEVLEMFGADGGDPRDGLSPVPRGGVTE